MISFAKLTCKRFVNLPPRLSQHWPCYSRPAALLKLAAFERADVIESITTRTAGAPIMAIVSLRSQRISGVRCRRLDHASACLQWSGGARNTHHRLDRR